MINRFSPAAAAAFELCFRPWMRSRVREVRITGLPRDLPPYEPFLLAANHVSWWDGFLLRAVQRSLRPHAPLYTVMTTRELARFPFFRFLGAVAIDPGSPPSVRGALRLLDKRLRERPDAVVAFFPQGRIWPSHRRPLGFERGVELFARSLPVRVLPVGLHAEPLNHVAPTHFVAVDEPPEGPVSAARLEEQVAGRIDAILAFLALHGEDAPLRWPALHDSIPPAEPSALA